MIKYWLGVTTAWDTPELVKDAYALAKAESHEWASFILHIRYKAVYGAILLWSQQNS